MRKRYKATFFLGTPDARPELVRAASICARWATSRNRATPQELLIDHDLPIIAGAFGEVRTVRVDELERILWGLEARTPDAEERERLVWITELTLSQSADRLSFTCSNGFASTGPMRPMRRPPSRPNVVTDLIRTFGAFRQRELATVPHTLGAERTKDFVARLVDPGRTRPIVLISARNWNDTPVVDAAAIADRLAGLAHVFVARDRFPSLEMPRLLPKPLCCWEGAVRLYWPGLRPNDAPADHPHWPIDEFDRIEDELYGGFPDYLFTQITQHAVYAADPEDVTIADIEGRRLRSQLTEMRSRPIASAADTTALLDATESWLAEKDLEINRLKDELASLGARVRQEQQKADAYLSALKAGATASETALPIDTVEDAIEQAMESFGDELVFALNGKSVIKRSEFDEPEDLYKALEWLATTYRDARIGSAPISDFDLSLREACGWTYEGSQSSVTMGKYAEWYETTHAGRTIQLGNHVGTGSSKDPRRTIRVAFAWESDDKKVIVGYNSTTSEDRQDLSLQVRRDRGRGETASAMSSSTSANMTRPLVSSRGPKVAPRATRRARRDARVLRWQVAPPGLRQSHRDRAAPDLADRRRRPRNASSASRAIATVARRDHLARKL